MGEGAIRGGGGGAKEWGSIGACEFLSVGEGAIRGGGVLRSGVQ